MGNKLTVDKLIEKYLDRLYHYASILICDSDEAKDVVHTVFLKFIETIKDGKEFNDERHEVNWLYKVTENYCKNINKSAKNRKVVPLTENINIVSKTENENELTLEIRKLKDKYRNVLELHYIQGLEIYEIAEILKITEVNVRKRLERGRNMIKENIRREEKI